MIELVAVLTVIAILTGLLLAAIARARNHARHTLAKNEVSHLEAAWNQYLTRYHRWPSFASETNAVALTEDVAAVLRGENRDGANRERLKFIDFSRFNTNSNPVSPWGRMFEDSTGCYYYVKFDTDYDGVIEEDDDGDEPPDHDVRRSVIVWTVDPNDGGLVTSWEP